MSALLRQRLLARFLGQAAGVLQARLLVVTGEGIERGIGPTLFRSVLARNLHPAVILHTRARRDQAAHDHVLLQAAQVVHLAVDGGFGEHARGLLEGGRGNKRIGGKRSLGDAQQHGLALRRPLARFQNFHVLVAELEPVHHLFRQEFGVADIFHLHPAHHLPGDDLEVLIVDIDTLQPVDFLNLVDQILLQFLLAQHVENVVGVARAIHEWLAGLDPLALLNVDVDAARQRILALLAVVAGHIDLALSLRHFAVLHDAVNFRDDGRLTRLARFEQLGHARQTAGDVLGLGGFARDLGQHVAGVDLVAIVHHQVGVRRHEVLLGFRTQARRAFRPHNNLRLPLLVGGIHDDELRHAGDFVHALLHGEAVDQVFEMHRAADFGQDREGVRIPFQQVLVGFNRSTVGGQHTGAVIHFIAFLFAALVVDHRYFSVAVHRDQFARLALHGLNAHVARETVALRVLGRLLADTAGGAADVEGAHGQLRAGLADGLGRDHTDRLAALDQPSSGQVAAVAHDTDAALGFAGKHRADLDAHDAGRLNGRREIFGDLLVDTHDHVAFVVLLVFERHAAHNAVAQRLDDFTRFDDRLDVDAFGGAAVVLGDDDVLRHVHQAPRQVAGIGGLQGGVGQPLAGAVRRDEVLQHVAAFAEVGRDGGFDDLARGLGHQSAHARKLADLLLGTARARVGHDVNGVEVAAGAVVLFHGRHHFVGDFLRDLGPDFNDLVIALAVGDGAVLVLVLDGDYFLLGLAHQSGFFGRHHHVVDADGNARARGVQEAQRFHFVEHLHGDVQPEFQIAVLHELAQALLLQKAVDERHVGREVVVDDHPADGGFHVLLDELDGFGVQDGLVVESVHQVDDAAGITQLDGGKRLHLAHFEGDEHVVVGGEGAALALGARTRLV